MGRQDGKVDFHVFLGHHSLIRWKIQHRTEIYLLPKLHFQLANEHPPGKTLGTFKFQHVQDLNSSSLNLKYTSPFNIPHCHPHTIVFCLFPLSLTTSNNHKVMFSHRDFFFFFFSISNCYRNCSGHLLQT